MVRIRPAGGASRLKTCGTRLTQPGCGQYLKDEDVSYELVSALAALGTFVVIGATAIVALVQLRHLRASNQIAAVTTLQATIQSDDFVSARRFIREELPTRLQDPSFRRELNRMPVGDAARPLLVVGNCYEELGTFVKRGMVDKDTACDLWSAIVEGDWKQMAPAIAIVRRKHGSSTWENFELMVDLTHRWFKRFPHGTYPTERKRLPVEDVWLAEDSAEDERAAR